ncbi:MAG: hypothetical protein COU98_01970 [Candidatus Staskawiczbacteria bacterium CG10_big_fil_rev_8_21_14_0_10_38_10]|uniref:DUF5667 domain-containing protein n=1 Tax=Candidatus Staskawiczbacteria bacterium CG10_big_fil_rev_8_21_14_0_10_38_10 TaxID=1974891 RepID=A0A2H9T157_9BACT|nr:MAG: hypothetical protein COU98_01970 [Candidatus Staskawiczbacteria bacterium CG10_big_fil_rev_8_21_14_0_10_38_10]
MKMNSKTLVSVLLVANIFLPNVILAQNGSNFCSRLSEFRTKVDQGIADREEKLNEKRNQILNRLEDRWDKRDNQLAEKRAKWDGNRDEHYAKLLERAKTEEQEQAVEKFKATIESAVVTRRTAVDAALVAFRQGLEQALTSRRTSVNGIIDIFKNSVASAFQKTEENCGSNIEKAPIVKDLRASLKAAREKFNADRQEIEKLGPVMSNLVITRNQAIQKAFQDFRTVVEEARKELKIAFPENTTE